MKSPLLRQHRFFRCLVATGLFLWLASCASPERRESPAVGTVEPSKTQKIEPEARLLFNQAERALNARNFEEARRLYAQIRVRYPKGRAAMVSAYRLATIYYQQEDFAASAREFEAFLSRYPQSDLTFDAVYNLAASEYQQGRYDKAYQSLTRLRTLDIGSQGPRRAEVVYQLTAQTAATLGNHPAAVTAYAEQMQLPLEEGKRANVLENIQSHLNRMTSASELERLLEQITEPMTRARITQRIAALASPEPGASASPRPSVEEEPRQQLTGSGSSGEKLHIGVILPLSGKYAAYGKKALDGILLASGLYFRNLNSELQLFIEDSQGNPAVAQQAVDKLVSQHRVMAILGPLHWKESVAVAERSLQLGVLNLTLSGKEGISEKGPYLFQNALTPRVQLESLVQHCIERRQFRRFAILAPSDSFGRDMSDRFWDLVEKYGGKVVAFKQYPPDSKDFQQPIREMTGLANFKFRRFELSKLADYVKEQKQKTGKEPKSQLPPIHDFDAIFIPDSPKNAATIAANLAYFDVQGVVMLGTTEWNSDQFYRRGGRYVEGALFPGGLSLATKNARQKEFIRLFTDAFGSAPDLLASQAYEAMELVAVALQNSSSDRNDLVRKLSLLKDFETPLGNVTFDSTRIARRRMPIYSLEAGGNIIEQ